MLEPDPPPSLPRTTAPLPAGAAIFHLALVLGLIPGVSGLIALWMGPQLREHEPRWMRRLSGLAILDSLILVALASLVFSTAPDAGAFTGSAGPPRIGVELDYSASSGALVRGVLPGSPAELADIRAGDSIVRVDDVAIPDAATLVETIGSGDAGASRRLEVMRGGASRTVDVAPRLGPWAHAASSPARCEDGALGAARLREAVASPATWSLLASVVVVLAALFAWGRRRGLPARESAAVLLPFAIALLLGSVPGQLVATLTCPSLVALGLRVETIGLLFGGAALAAVALVLLRVNRRLAPVLADDGPRYGLGRTLAQSIAYFFVWMPRAMLLVIPLSVWVGRDLGEAPVAAVLRGASRSPLDAALTLVAVAVLAPIAEESLFRGVLAPHLARLTSAFTAVLVTAAVFGALHIGGHGALFVGPLFLGAILGWARLRSGGMTAPIALHVLLNATSVSLSLVLGQ